jgi:hypothetical protein
MPVQWFLLFRNRRCQVRMLVEGSKGSLNAQEYLMMKLRIFL